MAPLDNGDVLSFVGAVLGAAITVWGSIWVINYQSWKRAKRDKANLLSFLAILETRLQFVKSDEALAEFIKARDVPGFLNRCALILEMAELLDSPAVAEAAEGYRQLYALHRLRRALKVWSHVFAEHADLPYTDFYKLASPKDFEAAVSKIWCPARSSGGQSISIYRRSRDETSSWKRLAASSEDSAHGTPTMSSCPRIVLRCTLEEGGIAGSADDGALASLISSNSGTGRVTYCHD